MEEKKPNLTSFNLKRMVRSNLKRKKRKVIGMSKISTLSKLLSMKPIILSSSTQRSYSGL
jgi:hypothetical protein